MNTIYEPELAMGLNRIETQTKTIERERQKKSKHYIKQTLNKQKWQEKKN